MPTNAENAYEALKQQVGTPEGTGEWVEITQDRVNEFADVTDDHQWIHDDPERCAEMSPWGTTIAHGFLTLSLLTPLTQSIPSDAPRLEGVLMGVNYGFDKVRFITPVKVGQRIRAHSSVSDVTLRDPNTVQVKRDIRVEIEGEAKPALAAEWLTLVSFT